MIKSPDRQLGMVHDSSPASDHVARKCQNYFFFYTVFRSRMKDGNHCETVEAPTLQG